MSRLATEEVHSPSGGEALPVLYVLHGVLGSGRNWSSFARRLLRLRPDWRAVLGDLRLHGASQGMPGPHNVAAAARDVMELRRTASAGSPGPVPEAILGHSFGGKVALEVQAASEPPLAQTWIVDSTPSAAEASGASAGMLARLEASPTDFSSRDAAVAYVRDAGFDLATARWMATNLERDGDRWRWGLDPAGLRQLLEDFAATDAWDVLENAAPDADIHFVRATRDSILSDAATNRIRNLEAQGAPVTLHTLDGGHWLHVDNPDGLLALVADRLPRIAGGSP